jgi:ATP-dependent DNA helicase RecG
MNKQELSALINLGEGQNLEFKESINSDLSKELVALANANGGIVLIGVSDAGNIRTKAFDNADRSKVESAARGCDPPVVISVEVVDDESNVLVVNVPSGLNKPYRCNKGFYLRDGSSSVKRRTAEIFEMFRVAGRIPFDDEICQDAHFETCFDPLTLKRFLAEAKVSQSLSDEDTLNNLGVLKEIEGKKLFTNAGVLFFTNVAKKLLPHTIIQCARYDGISKVDIADYKEMDRDVISNIDDCFTFLKRSLEVAFEFEVGKPTRTERWEIPYQALKEAIVNAIAHRDYVHRGTHIQIEVFDDRVSITNFGGLLDGMQKEDLGRKSVRRNHEMVNLFHMADFIEKMGTGILRINKELKSVGLPKPDFEANEHWFSIIFKRPSIIEKRKDSIEVINLNKRQKDIVKIIKLDSEITVRTLGEKLEVNKATIQRDLNYLKEEGVLTREGGTRGKWILNAIGLD